MTMKKAYSTPQMDIVILGQQQPLLIGSYDGPANAPEMDLGIGEVDIIGSDEVTFSDDVTVDFNSRVLGVQTAHWDMGTDFASEIAVCRTFVFFHEIEYLFKNNLIKGGDVDNAIVIVEYPTSEEQLRYVAEMIGKPVLRVTEKGYLDNLELHFDNECGRHKLLDLIGDMRLSGGWMNAHVTAFKPGHTINTMAAKELRKLLKNK